MSLVYITQHDENIYDYGKQQAYEDMKPPKYKSKAREHTKINKADTKRVGLNTFILTSTTKFSHKTMGYAETPLYGPCDFLRKNEGVRFRRKTNHVCVHKEIPPLPDFKSSAKTPEREQKNFKIKNIKSVVSKAPRRPKPRYAFTRTGDVRPLCNAGIMPAYILRPNYGQVPKYIIASKKAQKEAIEAMERSQKSTGFTLIGQEERLALLAGLKANWEAMQRSFQALPVLTDTLPKKKRKHEMEQVLRKLEQDILLLESNPLIYVCDEDKHQKTQPKKKNADIDT